MTNPVDTCLSNCFIGCIVSCSVSARDVQIVFALLRKMILKEIKVNRCYSNNALHTTASKDNYVTNRTLTGRVLSLAANQGAPSHRR